MFGQRQLFVLQCNILKLVTFHRVKPGSHTPPRYLRRSRRYCLRHYPDKWGHNTAGNKKPRRSLPPTCMRSRTRVTFAGMPVVKADMASVAGDFCSHISYVAGSSAASRPGRHLRTRGGRCWRATKVAPSTGTRGGGWGDESFFDQSRQMITDTPVDGKNGNLNRRTSKHHARFGHMRVPRNLKV